MEGAGHNMGGFFVILAAQVRAWLFERLNQPVVIGEVLAGILVGPALLG
ncbi:sodium:proton antiporter, partial [Thermus scotoductus]